ncbi:MAG: MarC family transcriptional regulator [Henriciella sp.]|jgi:multiple antibiotic resistance protein|uniref:MarC family protein n=1 Tax=Henriciella sp. TaxID=1968823 RepID=UPI000C104D16|nr:MarC family protein [Henriciella sp.]MAN72821.1 MarC family transcriptional regulator [Henriciella sp.]MBF33075.1 MarC family transcriptional regulator [Hyphomonadaceae bacterium]PHR79449.1 MAG: MarC family transcriptional regulator [Henriciella sp.]|tara:strand:- start:2950 stop:3582 length:633 start_codon:yes stop_codon:yes gene_type:complete
MTHSLLEQFVLLWVVIDPIGTIPVFIAVVAGVAAADRWKIAVKAIIAATFVLLLFLVGGQFLINALGISLPAFQIAGGIVLLLFALTMIFGDSKPESEAESWSAERDGHSSVAIFPLAMPSLASPGAILAVVVLTDNNRFSIQEQAMTAGVMLLVMACALILMLAATPILRVIRMAGAALVSRIMGMILAAVAVNTVILAVIELIRTVEI